jgi:hypothetical protein
LIMEGVEKIASRAGYSEASSCRRLIISRMITKRIVSEVLSRRGIGSA